MRNYKRKTTRQDWCTESMQKAVEAVNKNEMSLRQAAQTYGVPKSTLVDRIKKLKSGSTTLVEVALKGMGNFKKTFTDAQEQELVEYVKLMESRLFGLTTKDLRLLAFQLAEQNNIKHNFSNNIAGLDWLKGFLKRHKDLSLRRPEPTSAARAMGFNKTAVSNFFDNLVNCIDKYKIQPHRLYNVDETGITTVPKSHSKIIAQRGRRQVGTLTSAERGQTVTAELCFSASGHYIPPLLVFPRVRMKPELLDGAPLGTIAACHPSGWMQSDIFVRWMKHFAEHVKPSAEDPVLLLLDGHATHTKNLEVINYARANGIIMLCFPPHCTHRLQPLDVSFMAPLSTYYGQEQKTWLRNNPGRVVTQFQICKLFGVAYEKAATVQIATSGFRRCGIFPTDPNVFGEADFAPAETTEREKQATENMQSENTELAEEETRSLTPQPGPSGLNNLIAGQNSLHLDEEQIRPVTPQPKRSDALNSPILELQSSTFRTSAFSNSPGDILNVPVAKRAVPKAPRKRGKTTILTDSPYKNELTEALENQRQKKSVEVKRKLSSTETHKIKQKTVRKQKTLKKRKTVKKEKNTFSSSSDEEKDEEPMDDEDEVCIYCNESYAATSKNDGWVQCLQCAKWAHEGCTGLREEDLHAFKCNKCTYS